MRILEGNSAPKTPFTRMKYTFSILFWFRKDVRSDKNEGYISARVTLNGKRAEISTGYKIEADRWNAEGQLVKGNKEDARSINFQLTALRNRLNEIFTELSKTKEASLTLEQIKNSLSGENAEAIVKEKTLLEIFRQHNEKMKAQVGGDFAQNTLKKYNSTFNHVSAFIRHRYKATDISLSALNHEFLTDLEFWFKTVQKCSHNSTMKYIINLRKIIGIAVANDWMNKNPFDKFKISHKEVKREALTQDELQTLSEKTFAIKRLEQVCDIFLFCCYTGLAYADVEKLTPQQISRGIDGKYWIFTDRTKTKTASNIPLLSPAVVLIGKYQNHPQAENKGRIFPVLTNQKMNAYLKEIADVCGIEKPLTTHVARHTFATTVTLTNGVPLETVSSMLGHKNIRTTQIYAKVVQTKVSADMNRLESIFSGKEEAQQKQG